MSWSEADVTRLRELAIPLQVGTAEAAAVVSLTGGASVVGLGEATHGDASSTWMKAAVIRSLAVSGESVLVAWERGPSVMAAVDRSLSGGRDPDLALMWPHLYPWVYEEVAELFEWIKSWNAESPRSVRLVGVDMDSPPPEFELAALSKRARDQLRSFVERLRDGFRDAGVYSSAEWHQDRLAELDEVIQNDPAPAALGILRATRQWLEYRRLTITEGAWPAAGNFRDRCMADNLFSEREQLSCDRTVFWAHNGHVSLDPTMAGHRLARSLAGDYCAIGSAFGRGSFVAGTARPGGGFDPYLRVFDAEPPRPETMESLLEQVGIPV